MTKRLLLFILVITGFSSICLGQIKSPAAYSIDWITENSKTVTPQFQSFFMDEEINSDELPVKSYSIPLSGRPAEASATLTNTSVSRLKKGFKNKSLDSEFSITTEVKYSKNQAIAVVRIIPIRRGVNGLEKLESFDLDISKRGTRTRKARTRAAGNSVLSEGTWFKLRIEEDGIYRVDRSLLEELGLDISSLNPNQVNIYGNTGDQLPFDNSVPRLDDLEVNSTFFQGDSDDVWENNESLLFYGDGSDSWSYAATNVSLDFVPEKHNYSQFAYYFLRIDDIAPVRIQNAAVPDSPSSYISTSFDDRDFHELESVNLVKSGREWFGENFGLSNQLVLNFSFPNVLPDSAVIEISSAGRSLGGNSTFNYSLNSGESASSIMNAVNEGVVAPVVDIETETFTFFPSSTNVALTINWDQFSSDSEGWLDYVALQCRRELKLAGNFMPFRDQKSIGTGVTDYEVGQVFNPNTTSIWNITDPINPRIVEYTLEDNVAKFAHSASGLEEFVVFTNSTFLSPEVIGEVENQNLHALSGVDYVILTSPVFLDAANSLAEIHREDGLTVEVVTPEQVYNEFSSGNPDVTAIKMLMKMLYDDAAGDEELSPKYLCMFGDGTYRNRDLDPNSTLMISYHSKNSISPIASYVSDDYFGFLDDDESESTSDKMDIGIGRIVARNSTEAQQMVEKIRKYKAQNTSADGGAFCIGDATNSPFGAWRNRVVFVSDDQDGNIIDGDIHMEHSDELIDTIQTHHNEFNVEKIYADAYEQASTPGGERYADANDAIQRSVQDGALVVNYIGHGGEKGWAHERILDIPTIRNWTNSNRMPVFVTATCELTRFDDPDFLSAGELMFLNPDGGAIAMMTTTRIVFAGANQQLANAYYNAAFGENTPSTQTLGDAYMLTKNAVNGTNQKNFSLIGDPALKIAHPRHDVYTTQINGQNLEQFTDTLKALETVTISGYIGDAGGAILSDFNGFVYPTVFDKEQQLFSLANDAADNNSVLPYPFKLTKNVLYNGKATVSNGEFEFTFVIPRDINYVVGEGRVSYYAVDGSLDGHGFSQAFNIGGSSSDVTLNNEGPIIELFLNDETFITGGLTDETPILLAKLRDENGINTVGNGIGHDLKAVIDENTSQAIILNEYYEADEDTFQSGQIRFQLSSLEEGNHTLSLKAWDTHNNSNEESIEFTVASSEELALDHVLNYPNPFTTSTEFMFEHNAACTYLDVQIQVFTVAGNLAKTINQRIASSGYRVNGIMWDGKDDFGDELARGVYVYKVKITTPEGLKTEEFEKLVILK